MGIKNSKTTADFIPWEKLPSIFNRLEREKNHKFQLLIALGSFLGIRISDIKALRWNQLLDKTELHITEIKTRKQRSLIINDDLQRIIKTCYKEMKVRTTLECLFLNRFRKGVISTQYINRELKDILKPLGIRRASSHSLRKTFGREVWERDNRSERALIMLSELFNHSSTQITRRYLGLKQEELNNVYHSLSL